MGGALLTAKAEVDRAGQVSQQNASLVTRTSSGFTNQVHAWRDTA